MATTQAQRASLFNTLAELVGREDAETLMQQLPPGGWDSMATKDDLQVLAATVTAALAEFRVEVTNAFADAAKERAAIIKAFSERHSELVESQSELVKAFSERHSELVESQSELVKAFSERHSELVESQSEKHAELVKNYAGLVKTQARHLYITVSTIVLATVSIWIALLTGPSP